MIPREDLFWLYFKNKKDNQWDYKSLHCNKMIHEPTIIKISLWLLLSLKRTIQTELSFLIVKLYCNFLIFTVTDGFPSFQKFATLQLLYVAFPFARTRRIKVYSATGKLIQIFPPIASGEWKSLRRDVCHALYKLSDFA